MKRKLLLILRHGKSDWSTGLEDFHRPLVGRGRKGARKMGAWIRHLDLDPRRRTQFPGRRAKATTEAACKAMGIPLDTRALGRTALRGPRHAGALGAGRCPEEGQTRAARRPQPGPRGTRPPARRRPAGHSRRTASCCPPPHSPAWRSPATGATPGRAARTCSPSRGRGKSPTTKPPG